MKDWNLTCSSWDFCWFFIFCVRLEYGLVEIFGNLSFLAAPQLVTAKRYLMTLKAVSWLLNSLFLWFDAIFRLTIFKFLFLFKIRIVLLFFQPCGNCKIGSINNGWVKKNKSLLKKSQGFLISARLSSLYLAHLEKNPTLRYCNFSVQADQVPHLLLILSFSFCT